MSPHQERSSVIDISINAEVIQRRRERQICPSANGSSSQEQVIKTTKVCRPVVFSRSSFMRSRVETAASDRPEKSMKEDTHLLTLMKMNMGKLMT